MRDANEQFRCEKIDTFVKTHHLACLPREDSLLTKMKNLTDEAREKYRNDDMIGWYLKTPIWKESLTYTRTQS